MSAMIYVRRMSKNREGRSDEGEQETSRVE
jgi:hypothetical protein